MSRVITFSRTFPTYHPRKGQETFFVEKIWTALQKYDNFYPNQWVNKYPILMDLFMNPDVISFPSKLHTIRAGHRWKAGDVFSPRVWSSKPYASPQLTIAPDITINRVVTFEMDGAFIKVAGRLYGMRGSSDIEPIATNDGLSIEDFQDWFNKPVFDGQILIWSDKNLNY